MKQVLRPPYPDANMPKITLRENETMDSAMERFYKKVIYAYSRPWYKRRYGYYEKPSRVLILLRPDKNQLFFCSA
ncbi:MAG: 30S ribosomal protein S21 [Anaerolineae bacterium]|nr:30S ribosomal protein S21 [Anaerolineae bacterium]